MNQDNIIDELQKLDQQLSNSLKQQIREEKFKTDANSRFEKNLTCFKKFYADIAQTVSEFKLRENFCLHVTESGHGNFVPQNSDVPLYSDDPITQASNQVKAHIENPRCSLTDYSGYVKGETDKRIHSFYMTKLSEALKNTQNEHQKRISSLPDTFPSGVIFGVGLGYHIPLLLENTTFDYLFIIEPDIEQFIASLFCIDWFEIIEKIDKEGNCLFIHLGIEPETFIRDLEEVAEDIGAFSIVRSFIYQHRPDEELSRLIRTWLYEYFRFQSGHGFYNDAVTGIAHTIHHVRKKIPFFIEEWQSKSLKDVPVFIVANGPSVDEAEDYLRANAGKAIIVAAGTAVATLYKKNIPIDFHVLVERPYSNYKIFGDIFPKEEYKKLNLLGLNMLYPDTTDRYAWSGLAVKGNEAGTNLLNLLWLTLTSKSVHQIPYSNPVVANTALSFFLSFGCQNVTLFGVDNGASPSGKHHSSDSIYKKKNSDESDGYTSLEVKGKQLPGNFGGYVESNELLMMAHAQLEKLVAYFPKANVLNVGEGAKIQGAFPVHSSDLLTIEDDINKKEIIEYIKGAFFKKIPVDDIPEKLIAVDKFQLICDHLISISSEEVSTRKEASEKLKRQSRYLYSIRKTPCGHLFHVLKGALLYYHCPMITQLYLYESDEYSLSIYKKLNNLWSAYLTAMRDDFAVSFEAPCDLGKE